jgi:hypothetical protein
MQHADTVLLLHFLQPCKMLTHVGVRRWWCSPCTCAAGLVTPHTAGVLPLPQGATHPSAASSRHRRAAYQQPQPHLLQQQLPQQCAGLVLQPGVAGVTRAAGAALRSLWGGATGCSLPVAVTSTLQHAVNKSNRQVYCAQWSPPAVCFYLKLYLDALCCVVELADPFELVQCQLNVRLACAVHYRTC